MPAISSKLTLTSAANSAGTELADANLIKGAFYTVLEHDDLANIPISRIANKQVVWVEDESKTYQATVTLADYVSTFTDSVAWAEFTGFAGAVGINTGSAHFSSGVEDIVIVTTLDGGDI